MRDKNATVSPRRSSRAVGAGVGRVVVNRSVDGRHSSDMDLLLGLAAADVLPRCLESAQFIKALLGDRFRP